MYKFAYKPGIASLAQINGRGLLNWGEILAWDLQYVRTRSVWLDLKNYRGHVEARHYPTRRILIASHRTPKSEHRPCTAILSVVSPLAR